MIEQKQKKTQHRLDLFKHSKVLVGDIMREKVLILKTGWSEVLEADHTSRLTSLGDVLRTTCILHAFKDKHITWVTDERAVPLLQGNPYIDRIVPLDFVTMEQLRYEYFDIVLNLEKIPGICALVKDIDAWIKYGYRIDPRTGEIRAYNDSLNIFSISFSSKAKKANKKTFQELLYESIDRVWNGEDYILQNPGNAEQFDVALNTMVGQKWKSKQWSANNWDELEKQLERRGYTVTRQDKQSKDITGNLTEYIKWLNSCRSVISQDSLGLHIAIALNKPVLGIFGPTSSAEVYTYGNGKILVPRGKPSCIPCLDPNCKLHEGFIDKLRPSEVLKEFEILQANKK